MKKYEKEVRGVLKVTAILLCVTLMSTAVLSTTFAKYTTSGSGSTSARVAKWGLTLKPMTDVKKVWEISAGIKALSSTTDNIIAPGTGGDLVRFKLEGNPEVAQKVDFNLDFGIFGGYDNLIGQETYFPILITVGIKAYNGNGEVPVDGITTNNEYLIRSNETISKFAERVESEAKDLLDHDVTPNGWGGTEYAEYFVRWDWFYDDADIDASSITDATKTALKKYQDPEKDTMLAAAIVQRRKMAELNDGISSLTAAITSAESVYNSSGAKKDDYKTAIESLSNAINAFMGTSETFYTDGSTKDSYYYMESMSINWKQLLAGGFFTTKALTNYSLTFAENSLKVATKSEGAGDGSFYMRTKHEFLPINDDTYYEYEFGAINTVPTGYGGVMLATVPVDSGSGVNIIFIYGGFNNTSDVGNLNDLKLQRGTYTSDATLTEYEEKSIKKIGDYFRYKAVYDGRTLRMYYKANQNADYASLGGKTITLAEGACICLGFLARQKNKTNGNQRIVSIGECVLKKRKETDAKTLLNELILKAKDIKSQHDGDSESKHAFTISASADMTVTQKD